MPPADGPQPSSHVRAFQPLSLRAGVLVLLAAFTFVEPARTFADAYRVYADADACRSAHALGDAECLNAYANAKAEFDEHASLLGPERLSTPLRPLHDRRDRPPRRHVHAGDARLPHRQRSAATSPARGGRRRGRGVVSAARRRPRGYVGVRSAKSRGAERLEGDDVGASRGSGGRDGIAVGGRPRRDARLGRPAERAGPARDAPGPAKPRSVSSGSLQGREERRAGASGLPLSSRQESPLDAFERQAREHRGGESAGVDIDPVRRDSGASTGVCP